MPLPRMLMLGALVWSMLSFLATVGIGVPIQPTTLSYTPGARSLVVMLAFGVFAIYPLARISSARGPWPPARVALDAITLSVLFTILYWPMQLVTYWPRSLGLAIWILVLGWTWAASATCALALSHANGWRRIAWALACPTLLAIGAFLDAIGVPPPWPALAGPAVAVLEVAPGAPWEPSHFALPLAAFPWCIALLAWAWTAHRARRAFAASATLD